MLTIDVATAREVSAAAESRAGYARRTVSGAWRAPTAGALTFMGGRQDNAFARAHPILSCMGKTVIHAGGPGNGQARKICNNMILGISMMPFQKLLHLERNSASVSDVIRYRIQIVGASAGLNKLLPGAGTVKLSGKPRVCSRLTAAMMLKDLTPQDASSMTGATLP